MVCALTAWLSVCYTLKYSHKEVKSSAGFSPELGTVELDNEDGRTFLRVLIHLIMQDYPPLVSGSLQLIFKHFSQRAEVLQAFKQVTTKQLHLILAEAFSELSDFF